jgi:hypothetical protein
MGRNVVKVCAGQICVKLELQNRRVMSCQRYCETELVHRHNVTRNWC